MSICEDECGDCTICLGLYDDYDPELEDYLRREDEELLAFRTECEEE